MLSDQIKLSTFQKMPQDALRLVCFFLKPEDINKVESTSHHCRSIIYHDEQIWKQAAEKLQISYLNGWTWRDLTITYKNRQKIG